ncbi:hypothetical protein GOP47_0020966 [Adiantum capillus-veneris]|uniref:Uncharacterized protein n=1 Tax=Adiantum capillus-veneris TaxID=13818 RepID=A0A9D4UA71_ADICA|nr:hypothetical protein GOP47_0020966 [Adiantum capillus-veneris]
MSRLASQLQSSMGRPKSYIGTERERRAAASIAYYERRSACDRAAPPPRFLLLSTPVSLAPLDHRLLTSCLAAKSSLLPRTPPKTMHR